jgi:hypothetical protein
MLPQAMSSERGGREEVPPQGTTSGAGDSRNLLMSLTYVPVYVISLH